MGLAAKCKQHKVRLNTYNEAIELPDQLALRNMVDLKGFWIDFGRKMLWQRQIALFILDPDLRILHDVHCWLCVTLGT